MNKIEFPSKKIKEAGLMKKRASGKYSLFNRRGSQYVEYFILASTVAAASMWLWNWGNYHSGGGSWFSQQIHLIVQSP
jgi:hypothetical protein